MARDTATESFVVVKRAAARLGVPAAWLKAEALAGRVPYLRAGRRMLLNPQAVEQVLMDRARKAAGEGVNCG